ncbi:MAG: hypothetical protein DHS20C18_18390 [Saprospiraceae bacterium]|nr:MAG: hypothetical protein DHS20C18_18390 [Saprospiraceae bacterium]
MNEKKLLLIFSILLLNLALFGQRNQAGYFRFLDDAQIDFGLHLNGIFAMDDRAPLSANPHYQAMLNLITLGASLEALLQGMDEPLNDIDLNREFGNNGYNKTTIAFFLRYGFGESNDSRLQQHFLELGLGAGHFKGGKGLNFHLDYLYNIAKTNYGAGVNSMDRSFDYEIFVGARLGMDWSFRRSESQAGFFTHLSNEIDRIADEQEFTASQLIKLEDMLEQSRILLPDNVGGRAFHIGPVVGGRLSKKLLKNLRAYLSASAFYDAMDLTAGNANKENQRSQHQISIMLGLCMTLGSEGEMRVADFF